MRTSRMIDGKQAARIIDAEIQHYSDHRDISDFRNKWESDTESNSVRFQLALLLSKSSNVSDRKESLLHFQYLSHHPEYVSSSLLHQALVHYGFHEYDSARILCEELYRLEPDNLKVQHLHSAIVHKQSLKKADDQETAAIGITLGLGVVAVIGALALILRKKR